MYGTSHTMSRRYCNVKQPLTSYPVMSFGNDTETFQLTI